MILVIADDFTGAAELAGISLQYGLTVELCNNKVEYNNADVLIVCTNSRSLSKADAIKVTTSIVEAALQLQPTLIYKKIDSVLRGYVVDEIQIQMQLNKINSALIIPSNPSLGRIISNGEYFINGIKISETDFTNDPEFPIKSSFVKEILNNEVEVLKTTDEFPTYGIFIGEAATTEDVSDWAKRNFNNCLLVGAGDFYTALLQKQFKKVENIETGLQTPFLYVCGTSFKTSLNRIKELKEKASEIKLIDNYFSLLKISEEKTLLYINDSVIDCSALQLRRAMAATTVKLIAELKIKELFIEGGSTAACILEELKVDELQAINELSRGVVRMKANDLNITVKPGSYDLPKQLKLIEPQSH
jgi:D-threonate/D-erythronate kinase